MKIVKYLFVIGLIAFSLSGCKYSFIVPVEIPEEVSFAADIQPIFDAKCNVCHDSSETPNLTSGSSYSSLSTGFFDIENPEGSIIYTEPNPTGSHGNKYSPAEAAIVLSWIEQGAKNN